MARFKRPYTLINSAMTLDGKIATKIGDSEISCMDDKIELHKLRASTDGVMVGINTVLMDDPKLTVRYAEGKVKRKIIVDSYAKLPLDAKLLSSEGETILICGLEVSEERVAKLVERSVTVIKCRASGGMIDLVEALGKLREMGVERLLVEGGGRLNWSLLRLGLVDEVRLAISLRAIGSEGAKNIFEGESVEKIAKGISFKLSSYERCGCGAMLYLFLRPG